MSETVNAQQCQPCDEAAEPTSLEFAAELLGIRYADIDTLVDLTGNDTGSTDGQFDKGWRAGIEFDLESSSFPVGESTEHQKAWLLGFVAGQYAGTNEYPTPFCNNKEHEGTEY